MRSLILLLFCFRIFATPAFSQKKKIGIIGAMPEEIKLVLDSLKERKDTLIKGQVFYSGKLKNKEVVVVESGVGKANAAFSTTLLLSFFDISRVIFTGVAGGLNPRHFPGDIIIGTSVFHHDYGQILPEGLVLRKTRNVLNKIQNPLDFKCDSVLIAKATQAGVGLVLQKVEKRTPSIYAGKIATGDVFVSDKKKAEWLFNVTGSSAAEMEGAVVGQLCYQLDVPFLIIRSLSDNANNEATVDFNTFKVIASQNSALLLLRILE